MTRRRVVLLIILVLATGYLVYLKTLPPVEPPINLMINPTVTLLPVPPVVEIPTPVVEVPLNRISFYNAVPWQTEGDPNVSSCGPNRQKQIAVSRDLFFDENGRKHLCGVTVTVITDRGEEFRDYVIYDTMHPRYTNTADILIDSVEEALVLGVTTGRLLFHD